MTSTDNVIEPTSAWDPYSRGCPSRDVLDQIGSKWAVLVIGELGRRGPCRFTELRQAVGGVSEKMLTQTLRTLERDGLVLRTVYPEAPIRVEYELTALGQTLRGPLRALTEWSVENSAAVLAAREKYRAKTG
ncbi:transcriptional regulator [Actinoplanes ianthinogenes]|uniref:Transcriptional regulator n=1 Tax=Actinoplanes ianthinogenes TaxID=122358 RepID=A0ABM7M3B3_9ACTN|nr:helix-turn-helix domain-containing protein [Actinoplanes ianthinogenes]BCJ46043.1 transcriptional regulator [Actinoplanes ianthinogenes]GGR25842.1 transcriptional regulator [Actinoplanes ianthinogenes]